MKGKKIWRKAIIGLIAILILIVGGIAWTINSTLNKLDKEDIDESKLLINQEELNNYENSEEIINIALFGVDSEDGSSGRTDSIMILTLDTVHKKIKVTSIMRDSYVNIDNYGMDKINHAYAYGKAELAISTINQNFGMDIQDYALVNFTSLPAIVNALGGIDLEIAEDEVQYMNEYIDNINYLEGTSSPHITTAGVHHLDGVQSLAYARVRYTDGGDYMRTERHRIILNALFEKIKKIPATEYLSTLNTLLPYIKTSLSSSEILSLTTNILNIISNPELQMSRLPLDGHCEGIMLNGVYYLSFDREYTKQKFMDYIFNDIDME